MDTAHQWPQFQETAPPRPVGERKVRPQKDEALNCPRCHSTNTKFCYYNNYSLTQPRYFCKSCRRYWTAGGSLRNVPVGGGSRKNKRSSTISSSKPEFSSQNPNLNLASFSAAPQEYHGVTQFLEVPKIENNNNNNNIQLNLSSYPSSSLSAVELLKSSGIAMRGLNNSNYSAAPVVNPNMMYPSGFSFQEFKPQVVGFAVDELEKRYEGHHANNSQENGAAGGKLFFPSFGALSKQNEPSTNEVDNQNKGHGHGGNPPFYWNGNGW